MEKITIILHYRRDCDDREHNLRTILRFIDTKLTPIFDVRVNIVNDNVEFDDEVGKLKFKYNNTVRAVFMKNEDEFKKSKSFNVAASHEYFDTHGEILIFWDVDVLIDPKFIQEGVELILSRKVDHVYPFTGEFINVGKNCFAEFMVNEDYNFNWLLQAKQEKNENLELASPSSPGGCNIISREAFKRCKGYYEGFVGWGFEDTDFLNRSSTVNRVCYLSNPNAICWHLEHEGSKRLENPHYRSNLNLYNHNLLSYQKGEIPE